MTETRSDMTTWTRVLLTGAIIAAVAISAQPTPAHAQTPATAPAAATPPTAAEAARELTRLWDNFIHGIKVARIELAESNGRALLEHEASARDIYLLSAKELDLDWVLKRGEGLEGLKPVIDDVRAIIEKGYESERGDPKQIGASIDMLARSLRAFEIGKGRLAVSGEYAVPQLVQKLTDRTTSDTLRERIIAVMPNLGVEAVRPISAAMAGNDEALLQILADTLGKIGYSEGAPALKELLERDDISERTRQIATVALTDCAGEVALSRPVASVLYDQAEKYYYAAGPAQPGAGKSTRNVWFWQEGLGLNYTSVPAEIFGDVYAMRLARRALAHDGEFYPAVSLWLAARIKKEIDLPAGAVDPTVEPGSPSARFYALAGSAKYMQDVLARALRDKNAALALRAIEALARTAGAESLVQPSAGGIQPLVEAMTNRDRDVRVLAAMTLANALPQQHFTGDDMVVVVLNEALRQVGTRRALLLAAGQEERNSLLDALRTAGYEVIDFADADKAIAAAREAGGVDIVVVGSQPSPAAFVQRMRLDPVLAGLPAVVIGADDAAQRLAKSDGAVTLLAPDAAAPQVAAAITQAAQVGAAAQSREQQAAYAVRAAGAIEMLGRSGNQVYDLARAVPALVAALGDASDGVSMAAAKALAVLDNRDAQQALAAGAMRERTEMSVRIAMLDLLSGSLRRFGNLLADQQASGIVAIVTDPEQTQTLRDAAAGAVGAMDLPSAKIKDLILTSGGQ